MCPRIFRHPKRFILHGKNIPGWRLFLSLRWNLFVFGSDKKNMLATPKHLPSLVFLFGTSTSWRKSTPLIGRLHTRRDSNWHTLWAAVLVPEWVRCWSRKSARSTRTGSWTLIRWCRRPRCRTRWWSRTTRRFQCTNWWRTRTSRIWSTTRRCTTFATGRWSWPTRHTVTSTTWCRWLCPAWPRVSGSRASWTPISASWPSTWCRSRVSTSSCPASRHWRPAVALSSRLPAYRCSRSKCSTPRTWWWRATRDTDATLPWPPFSGRFIYYDNVIISFSLRNYCWPDVETYALLSVCRRHEAVRISRLQ